MFNIFFDEPPEYVTIFNLKFEINSDFRAVIKIYKIIEDANGDIEPKIDDINSLFYKKPQELNNDIFKSFAFREVFDFIFFDRDENEDNEENSGKEQTMDLTEDAPMIYAAFRHRYNIDLNTEPLHWFKFKILLGDLGECAFSNAVYYRGYDLSGVTDAKERERVTKIKKAVRLKKYRNAEKVMSGFLDKLRADIEREKDKKL
jgi:hypothetical protein